MRPAHLVSDMVDSMAIEPSKPLLTSSRLALMHRYLGYAGSPNRLDASGRWFLCSRGYEGFLKHSVFNLWTTGHCECSLLSGLFESGHLAMSSYL
ncbi:hypothetical protein FNV43_RR00355 [Rhamnella rubrinervis]|uniref:Uncharacterized protein n=1 Tax=Rhamnella rubrinervis TaxID=2594499 RepID=A0A8K0HQF6_9ROSA|nr:hypothetical protein FNV43_RR00355 [Rhamnella rubrinervis]